MLTDKIPVKGKLHIVLKDSEGNIKDERHITNLVVSTGLAHLTSRAIDATDAVMSHMAVGTDNTAAALGNTALGTELARVSFDSNTDSGAVLTFVATFPAGTGTGALTEAGIFNAASSGTMFSRAVFSTVNKAASDIVEITWTVTLG